MHRLAPTQVETALAQARTLLAAGKTADAVTAFEDARHAGASMRQTAEQHAIALSDLGRHAEAIEVLKPWFMKNRKSYPVVNLMGVLLKRDGRFDKALAILKQARKLKPGILSAWQNIGNIHDATGNPEEAAKAFRGALRINPKSAELWRLHGRALLELGQTDDALRSLRQAVSLAPGDSVAISILTTALRGEGRAEEAWTLLRKLFEKRPDDSDLAVLIARMHYRDGALDKARDVLAGVLAAQPGHLSANMLLAVTYGDADRKAANAAYERAVESNPHSFEPLNQLVDSLCRSRYGSEVEHLERAYVLGLRLLDEFPSCKPASARTLRTVFMRLLDEDAMARTGATADLLPVWLADGRHSNVHYELGLVNSIEDRLRLVEWHREWGRKASRRISPVKPVQMPALATGRKLRVGFMSSDLRQHPVTYFALPLLEGYDRDRVEVHCYSFNENAADNAQNFIARQVTAFRHWPKRPDAQVAEGIAADGLDILFELGGSTAMNKLEVMARRPARLGASWLGYPHSAGLEQIDLILTDPYIRPDDPGLLIERPFEMPQTWVAISRMFAEVEIADGTPESRKGYLTFGTANNPYKFTPICLDTWAAVLQAVPGSRFLFLRPEAGAESFVRNARTAFARRDVDPDRIEFIGVRGRHLPHYNEIDIALDTLPHVGGTTTCEALWMGVPTVSLVGPGFPERLSYSNLSNAGLPDLAVFSVEDYIAKAADLAADSGRRAAIRRTARATIRDNPLGQPDRFTRAFYDLAQRVASE